MPLKEIDDVRYFFADRGQGPAIVLLHAFPVDGRMWESQIEHLSDRYRVIAPDLRGFGQTKSDKPFTIESLAKDVHTLLGRLGALPCLLGGLSMGGYIALAFAQRFAGDLRGVALMDTRADADSPAARAGREQLIKTAEEKGVSAVADAMIPKLLGETTRTHRKDLVHRVRNLIESQSVITVVHALQAMRDRPDMTASLGSIAVPVLLLAGQEDTATPPALAEGMSKAIRHPRLSVIPSAGHLCAIEQPDEVTTELRRFAETLV